PSRCSLWSADADVVEVDIERLKPDPGRPNSYAACGSIGYGDLGPGAGGGAAPQVVRAGGACVSGTGRPSHRREAAQSPRFTRQDSRRARTAFHPIAQGHGRAADVSRRDPGTAED